VVNDSPRCGAGVRGIVAECGRRAEVAAEQCGDRTRPGQARNAAHSPTKGCPDGPAQCAHGLPSKLTSTEVAAAVASLFTR
jgi:hypothetical protein